MPQQGDDLSVCAVGGIGLSAASVRRRTHGWQCPWRWEQAAATAAALVMIGLSLAVLLTTLNGTPTIRDAVLFVYLVLLGIFVLCWVFVESVDPAGEGGVRCPCMRETQNGPAKWSSEMQAPIPGFDHFCPWAIGTRNYPCFYTLAVVGTLKYLFTVVLGVMLVTTIPPEGLETEPWYLSVMTLYILASMACAIAFLSLCGFQTYLQACWGVGTLDWLTKRWQATVAQRHTPASTVHSQPRTTTTSSPSTGTATVVHVAASTAAANSHTVAGNSTSTSQKAPRAPSRPTSRRIASPDTAMMASVIAEETEESGGEESVVEGGGWAEAAPASEPAVQGTETVQEEEEAESEESERESESAAPLASGSPPAGPGSAAATPSHDSDGDEPPDAVCLDKAGSDEGREDGQGGEACDASATDGETRPPGPPPSPVPHTTPASPPQPQPQ